MIGSHFEERGLKKYKEMMGTIKIYEVKTVCFMAG
jgi:hypothetical protein